FIGLGLHIHHDFLSPLQITTTELSQLMALPVAQSTRHIQKKHF
ncbi:MAG: hypothetical protein ACI90G_001621, partial [Urechidicola sp.]